MGTYSNFRRSVVACLAALVPAGALALPATASAEASAADCAELSTLYSSFIIVVKDVFDPKDVQALEHGGSFDDKKMDSTIDKRLDEVDPITGKPRIELFLEHLRDLDALAHDADGKLEDPEAAEAVEKLADGLDNYLGLIDRLKSAHGEAEDQDGSDTDSPEPADAEGSDKDDFGAEAALASFNSGIDAFTDYLDKSGCDRA
ncbi:hypothetical protein [Segniliparus rugosus]|uniref:Uncharacterized protein n=1 Tax=Segniliparus rugosus (strain ATCC BAA-974 / DSM 45345 / CCUG 50838 / CIP 108380 / JCM 13579 / CDC 945) TaxID=679197 RepID=E5XPH5_SEGRC|nr:hypothetical protein [Segniliparus rugosus]EFV13738.1 hypothetical protein HMPREF9336_01397 [Segniliparus rugosus ATCC BAA-974]